MPRSLVPTLLLAALLPVALAVASPAAAWKESLETPEGLARVEGDSREGEPLRLLLSERELWRTEDWLRIWPEAVAGDWLLVGVTQGGTACPIEWIWIHRASGAASEVFGTCAMAREVRVEPDESLSVLMSSYDPDEPVSRFAFDGATIREFRQGQEPAAVPPGAPADDWVGRWPYELFVASDWRGPLIALLGEEGYDEAQAAFGQVGPFEVEGDWVAAWGCIMHACPMLEGRIAIHRGDGRIIVALAEIDAAPRLYGDPRGPLPPTVAELMERP